MYSPLHFKMTRELQGDAYNGKTTVSEFHIFVARVAGVSHVSLDCHRDVASRKIVPQCHAMSQTCRQMSPRCHSRVTYLSHAVTSCRNNCHTNHAVSQSVNTSVDM